MAGNPFKMGITSPQIENMLARARVMSPANYKNILIFLGKRVSIKMESMIPPYPQAKKRTLKKVYTRTNKDGEAYKSVFKSEKQQAYVFWLLKQNMIPYKKTGLLGQSLNSEYRITDDSLVVSTGTSIGYAQEVIDEENQAPIHEDTWWTLQETYREGQEEIAQYAQQQLFFALGSN